jgi:hypothetical protein
MRTFFVTMALAAASTGCWTQSAPMPGTPVANVAPAATRPTSSLAGDYRASHTIRVVCDAGVDGWCDEEAEDLLTIRDTRSGTIAVTIELTRTNAHTCSFEGELVPVPSASRGDARRWSFQREDDVGPCTLTLEQTATELHVSAEGCHYYCGARAHLDATFALADRSR